MEHTLMTMALRFKELESELLHGGYNGEFLNEMILDQMTDEILSDPESNAKQIIIINAFFLGKILSK